MYNAILVPKVRYNDKLSPTAKLIFCEMTACVNEDQLMDDNPEYFAQELHIPIKDVQSAYSELLKHKFIIKHQGFIWVDL